MSGRPVLPSLLRPLATDEYRAPRPNAALRAATTRVAVGEAASRLGTAAALRAVDRSAGGGFYDVPAAAEHDLAAADDAFAPTGPVVDVQTHLVPAPRFDRGGTALRSFLRMVDPDRWSEPIDARRLAAASWAAHVFGASETAVALLTALPGPGDGALLHNEEIAAVRELVDRYAGTGRLLTHAIVHPNLGAAERDRLPEWSETLRPAAWKVYTLWDPPEVATGGFFLDDEQFGVPFLEAVRASGPRIVCAHKGIAGPVPDATPMGASPRDIGPAAARFADIEFVVYHSGYDVDPIGAEGAYEPAGTGVNRLVTSLATAGIGPGGNVWAELGSTWFLMLRRPVEAAHVLGKLLVAVGPDRILWGTDSVWYGSPQPLIDAFRAFTIPEWMQHRFGYPALTPAIKARILGANAARLYAVDPAVVQTPLAAPVAASLAAALDTIPGT